MEDDPGGLATASGGGHLERIRNELGAHVFGHRVTEQATRTEIEDGRDVQPSFTGRDVGDVTTPHDIGRGGREAPADEIWQRWVLLGRDRGAHLGRLVHADDAVNAHQSPDALVVHHASPTCEFLGHARLAIGGVGLGVDLAHHRDQLGLRELPERLVQPRFGPASRGTPDGTRLRPHTPS